MQTMVFASEEQAGFWFVPGWGLSLRGEHPGLLMIAAHHPGVQSLPGELAGTEGIPLPRRASPTADLSLSHHYSPSTLLGGQPTSGSAPGTSQPPSFPVCTQHTRLSGWLRKLGMLGRGRRALGWQGRQPRVQGRFASEAPLVPSTYQPRSLSSP